MKAKYEKGKIEFDFWDLLGQLEFEEKVHLIQTLACDADIIKHVIAQVLDGFTDNCSYGGRTCVASDNPEMGLDWACRQVARRSGEVAALEIKRLEDAVRFNKNESDTYRNALIEIQNKLRSGY